MKSLHINLKCFSICNVKRVKAKPTWSDVKAKLADFDRAGLLGLIQDLYAASKDNQLFLHTRFGLSGNVLAPYKKEIERSIFPNVYRQETPSVAQGKQAIADYRKAIGDPEGMVELMVFYCELASSFIAEYGEDDRTYINNLSSMFVEALKATLPEDLQRGFIARMDDVRVTSHRFGYGVADEMDDLLAEFSE